MVFLRIISVAGLSYLWPKSAIPYDDLVWNDTPWDPLAAYGQSNLARILFTRELARQAKINGDQFSSYAVHPGIVQTHFNRQKLQVNTENYKVKLDQVIFKTSITICISITYPRNEFFRMMNALGKIISKVVLFRCMKDYFSSPRKQVLKQSCIVV